METSTGFGETGPGFADPVLSWRNPDRIRGTGSGSGKTGPVSEDPERVAGNEDYSAGSCLEG